jgi:hypothetical protein
MKKKVFGCTLFLIFTLSISAFVFAADYPQQNLVRVCPLEALNHFNQPATVPFSSDYCADYTRTVYAPDLISRLEEAASRGEYVYVAVFSFYLSDDNVLHELDEPTTRNEIFIPVNGDLHLFAWVFIDGVFWMGENMTSSNILLNGSMTLNRRNGAQVSSRPLNNFVISPRMVMQMADFRTTDFAWWRSTAAFHQSGFASSFTRNVYMRWPEQYGSW